MNAIREIEQINQIELERGIAGTPGSWHAKYSRSAWVYLGNLDHALTEGDIICVLSQYGEIEDIHLVRDEQTGKSKGFCFVKFEDARSCVLAVDNFVGIKVRVIMLAREISFINTRQSLYLLILNMVALSLLFVYETLSSFYYVALPYPFVKLAVRSVVTN